MSDEVSRETRSLPQGKSLPDPATQTTQRWPDRSRLDEIQVDWLPIGSAAPGDVLQTAKYVLPPRLGQYVGKVETLPDGRWLVLKFPNTGGEPESYFILPLPPL